jgi:hypothetical protein
MPWVAAAVEYANDSDGGCVVKVVNAVGESPEYGAAQPPGNDGIGFRVAANPLTTASSRQIDQVGFGRDFKDDSGGHRDWSQAFTSSQDSAGDSSQHSEKL